MFFRKRLLILFACALSGLVSTACGQSLTSLLVLGGDHAYYIATSQHVFQLYWSGQSWVNQDLTVASGAATLPAPGSALTSVLVGNSDHVYYVDTNQHVNQLFFNSLNWVWQDLTAAAGATNVSAQKVSLTGFSLNGADHIIYLAGNQHVNHAWWNGSSWSNEDLNALAQPSAVADPGTALSSYTDNNGMVHVYYLDVNEHVCQLWWSGQAWVNQDWTAASGTSAVATPGSALSSYSAFNGLEFVYYFDSNHHVNQLWWTGQGWNNQDWTALSNARTVAAAGSSLSSMPGPNNGTQFVHYLDTNRHINELSWTGQTWTNQDLTALSGTSTLAAAATNLTNLVVTGGNHIYYIDTQGHINQIYWTGQAWVDQDLTIMGGGPVSAPALAVSREYIYFNGQVVATENPNH